MARAKGLRSFNKRMAKIPKSVRRAAQLKIDQNAAELVAIQKSYAPEKDGDLINSIESATLTNGRVGRIVVAGGDETTRPVRDGASAEYDYALAQEFGTQRQTANPFFFPPYRLKRRAFNARTTRAIKKAIRDSRA